jgi:hypothetical protein
MGDCVVERKRWVIALEEKDKKLITKISVGLYDNSDYLKHQTTL